MQADELLLPSPLHRCAAQAFDPGSYTSTKIVLTGLPIKAPVNISLQRKVTE